MLEDVVDGFFGLLLRGKIQPLEIARRLTREAEEQKIITLNRVYIPNRFTVGLHPQDMAQLQAIAPELQAEFERFVGEWAMDRDYSVSGSIQVNLEQAAEKVGRGRMRIRAEIDDVRLAEDAARKRLGLDLGAPLETVPDPEEPEVAPVARRRQAA
jgi:hypothetical protein